jgi:hypothetical protein
MISVSPHTSRRSLPPAYRTGSEVIAVLPRPTPDVSVRPRPGGSEPPGRGHERQRVAVAPVAVSGDSRESPTDRATATRIPITGGMPIPSSPLSQASPAATA